MRHCVPADEFNSWASQKQGPCIYIDAAGGIDAWGLSGFQEWKVTLTTGWLGTALILQLIQTVMDLSYWNENGRIN